MAGDYLINKNLNFATVLVLEFLKEKLPPISWSNQLKEIDF